MKYKLKEHVTDEMLIECGFEVSTINKRNKGAYKCRHDDVEIYIPLFDSIYGERIIQYAPYGNDDEMLKEHIQDLIEKDYVEVVE